MPRLLNILAVIICVIGGVVVVSCGVTMDGIVGAYLRNAAVPFNSTALTLMLCAAGACGVALYLSWPAVRHLRKPTLSTAQDVVTLGTYLLIFLCLGVLFKRPALWFVGFLAIGLVRHSLLKHFAGAGVRAE